MKKIIIIDGNSLAYSRVPDIKKVAKNEMYAATDNRDIYIVRKFIKKLLRLKYTMYNGYHFIVVFDEQNKHTFRHDLDKRYKSKTLTPKRQEQKDYVYAQIKEIRKALDIMNIPHYSSPKWEADDLIGMLTKKFEGMGILTTVVSGDKDILQLISGRTRVRFTSTSNNDVVADRKNLWDVSGGVWPDQLIEIKMLAGDTSDNIKGIGLIRNGKVEYWTKDEATEHIIKWGSVKNMIANSSKLKSPYDVSIEKGKDKLNLNRKLVTIVRKWSIEEDVSFFLDKRVNVEGIKSVITDLNLEIMNKNKRFKKNFGEEK